MKYKRRILMVLISAVLLFAFVSAASGGVKFSDVKGSDWFYNDIISLVQAGGISGYSDGTFRPQEQMDRAACLRILVDSLHIPLTSGQGFEDTESHWAKNYVSTALANGIIKKEDYNNKFEPDRKITRLEVTTMIVRALKLEPAETNKNSPFVDIDIPLATMVYDEYLIRGTGINGKRYFLPDKILTRAEASAMLNRAYEYSIDREIFKAKASLFDVPIVPTTLDDAFFKDPNTALLTSVNRYDVVGGRILFKDAEGTPPYSGYVLEESFNPGINDKVKSLTMALIANGSYVNTGYMQDKFIPSYAFVGLCKSSIASAYGNGNFRFDFREKEPFEEGSSPNRLWVERLNGGNFNVVEEPYRQKLQTCLIILYGEENGSQILAYVLEKYTQVQINGGFRSSTMETIEVGGITVIFTNQGSNCFFYFSR